MKSKILSLKTVILKLDFLKKQISYNETFEEKEFALACKQVNRKIHNRRNAKEHYQPFIRKKNTKLLKEPKIITYQPKNFENPNIANIKSFITEHPQVSHKLSKTIRREHSFKGFASTYIVEILNSFNTELQLKDTESGIKSKLIEVLT